MLGISDDGGGFTQEVELALSFNVTWNPAFSDVLSKEYEEMTKQASLLVGCQTRLIVRAVRVRIVQIVRKA